MKIDSVPLEDHQVKLTVEVDPESFENSKRRAARKLSKRAKIPGFRPGKAPYPVIVRHIGESVIIEEAVELTVGDIYPGVIEEAKIEPYGPGTLEGIPEMDPPTFEFVVPLRATVELGEYQSIRLPYELKEITDKDVDDVVNNLREQQAVIEPVDRPAQEGDLITVRLNAIRSQTENGEDTKLIDNRSFPVVIEAEDVDDSEEWPYPDFSRDLIGINKNDEKSTTYSYPEDSPMEAYQGMEVEFTILVEDIRSRTLPEVNDELALSMGEFETLDDLRTTIRENLEAQSRQAYDDEYGTDVLDEIVEISTIKYPPQMLAHEMDIVINNMERRLESQGLDMELYLKSRELDMDSFKEEVKPVAEGRLLKSLVLLEIAEVENIQVAPEELQEETRRTLDQASRALSVKELRELTSKDSATNLVSNIMMDLMLQKTQERVLNIARGLETMEDSEEAEEEELETVASTDDGTVNIEYAVDSETALDEAVEENEEEYDQPINNAEEAKQEEDDQTQE